MVAEVLQTRMAKVHTEMHQEAASKAVGMYIGCMHTQAF